MRFKEIDLILLLTLLLLIVAIVMIVIIIFAFINLKKQRKMHAFEIDKFNDYKIKEQEEWLNLSFL